MMRANGIWITGICAIGCLIGAAHWFTTSPIYAQQSTQPPTDDGNVYVYASVDVDSNYNLYADSYAELDFEADEDIDLVQDEIRVDQDQDVFFDDYAEPDEEASVYPELESTSPVAPGHEYGVLSIGSVCLDDGEGDCDWYDEDYAYASVNVASPPPLIKNITPSSVHQGDQGTLTVIGTNLVESSGDQLTINLAGSSAPFTQTGTPTSNTATFSYDFSWYPAGTYTLSVTNNEGPSNSVTFTVLSAPPPPPPPSSCAVTSNPQAGYSSIVSTGTAGGSGTLAVSFSGAAFAAISPTVTYGPSSTPSSIAANIAALITRNYFQYGLSAKAFGSNIVYSGNTKLGTVSNAVTGNGGAAPSFTTTTSAGAASTAEMACQQAPTTPAPAVEVAIVGWIDGSAIKLPSGESSSVDAAFPPSGVGGPLNNPVQYAACIGQTAALALGSSGVASSANDKAYASAWLLKFSGNQDPGSSITPSTFKSQVNSFRLFNDYSPGLGISNTAVGNTLDPCGSGIGVVGMADPHNGAVGTSLFGDQYQLAEVRVDQAGQKGWMALNNGRAIPWVWSVIEFNPSGYPDYGRIQNASPTISTTNYQIFPTYSVYIGGKRVYVVHQGTPAAFAGLPPGSELSPSSIQ
jgi:hypothetical protein